MKPREINQSIVITLCIKYERRQYMEDFQVNGCAIHLTHHRPASLSLLAYELEVRTMENFRCFCVSGILLPLFQGFPSLALNPIVPSSSSSAQVPSFLGAMCVAPLKPFASH